MAKIALVVLPPTWRIDTFGLCGIVSLVLLVLPIAGYREDRRRRAGR
jgi:hypothetical protein